MDAVAAEIWKAVKACNRAWLRGEPRAAAEIFHAHVVGIAPGFAGRIEGRDAMVQSLVDYCAQVKTHLFQEGEPAIDRIADTAVVAYPFVVQYELAGRVFDERGREILVLVRDAGRWQVMWRTQVSA
jgi:hypothetical protein